MIAPVTFMDSLDAYCDGVLSGEIVVGKWVRLAVERHLADLEREQSDEFPYYFDEREAEQVCAFFPLCFRHSKGRWGGRAFELADWQLFIVAVLFGWRRETTEDERDDGMAECVRRFRRALVSVARKNGKTTMAAGIGLYMGTADNENVAEVYTAATKMDQAKLCLFAEAARIVRKSKHLNKRSRIYTNSISFPGLDSYLRPLGSDRPFDGLNPHCVILDEIHAWKEQHRDFFETMKTGSGARDQPLLLSITTAGDDKSGLWMEETTYNKGVLEGLYSDESAFSYIAEIDEGDDPFDESCWAKANPCLGESVSADYIRELAKEAKAIHAKRNTFLRYHCNIVVTSTERAFDLDEWDACGGVLSDWSKADAVAAGFDIGTRDDLAAFGLCARFPIDQDDDGHQIYRYEIQAKAFMSEQTTRNMNEQPWPEFIEGGLLTVNQYVVRAMRSELIEACEEHRVGAVAFDPYQAQQLSEDLRDEGIPVISMAQTYSKFSEPIQEMQSALSEKRLTHDSSDSLLRWCASNTVIVKDRNDRWMYDKKGSKEKIDPIVAVTMALKCCMAMESRCTGPLFIA